LEEEMLSISKDELLKLLQVCQGKEPADLVVGESKIVNVYTGEILSGYSIGIKGKWIVRLDKDLSSIIGPETEYLDVRGKYVIPGLIDGHAHIMAYCHPHDFLKEAVKRGVTTLITELLDFSFKVDAQGMIEYLSATKGQPVKVFATIPPFITLSESAKRRIPDFKKILKLLRREDVLGVGESFWQEILRGHPLFFDILPYVSRMKKTLEGHAAGCKGEKLQSYILTGVGSCHEPISYDEVLERLRLGIYAMVREGSVRTDVGSLSHLKRSRLDTRRIILVSDFISPEEILEKGYMDYVVNRAIESGIDPVSAIQMATLNPATHFGLDSRLGGIAPGRYADLVVTKSIKRIEPEVVISDGKISIKDGRFLLDPVKKRLTIGGFKRSKISPKDLLIRTQRRGKIKVRIVDLVTELVTKEKVEEMKVEGKEVRADVERDILKLSYVTEDGCYNYLIKGMGLKEGAFATSSLWETYGILVIGVNPEDMSFAVNRIIEKGGGMVIVKEGRILEELPLPFGSLISNLSFEEVARKIKSLNENVRRMGVKWQKPFLTLETLTTPAIPFIRVSDRGLVDLKTGATLGLFVD